MIGCGQENATTEADVDEVEFEVDEDEYEDVEGEHESKAWAEEQEVHFMGIGVSVCTAARWAAGLRKGCGGGIGPALG